MIGAREMAIDTAVDTSPSRASHHGFGRNPAAILLGSCRVRRMNLAIAIFPQLAALQDQAFRRFGALLEAHERNRELLLQLGLFG